MKIKKGDNVIVIAGANKGKTAAVRAEVLNRLGAYVSFAVCLVALGYGIMLVAPWIFGIADK